MNKAKIIFILLILSIISLTISRDNETNSPISSENEEQSFSTSTPSQEIQREAQIHIKEPRKVGLKPKKNKVIRTKKEQEDIHQRENVPSQEETEDVTDKAVIPRVPEDLYSELMTDDAYPCCTVKLEGLGQDFKFWEGAYQITVHNRGLVDGLERSRSSYTQFWLDFKVENNFLYPTSIQNGVDGRMTSSGLIQLSKRQQNELKTKISNRTMRLPVIRQTASYFIGPLYKAFPKRFSFEQNYFSDVNTVQEICKEFLIVPNRWLHQSREGMNPIKEAVIGLLYCKVASDNYKKIGVTTLKGVESKKWSER